MPRSRFAVLLCTALLLVGVADLRAQEKTGFLDKVYREGDGDARYIVFVPKTYTGEKEYPVILFLHGAGETGTDGKRQAAVGLGKAIRNKKGDFPFIVVFPQSQKRTWRAGSGDAKRALAILEVVQKSYKTDKKRVYLTGLSMGGFGTWSLAAAYPDRWAAIAPVCGGGDPKSAGKIKDIPTWNFHGDADKAVNVKLSRAMIAAIKKAGGNPRYDEYPGVGHNSWDRAYGNAELYTWFLKHSTK
ncbi:MAG: dienelactone hydrolase family protein [Planctomycetes bacterium]|nr:dienelactone hydrolase family protein [Planctomycetota bacterium]